MKKQVIAWCLSSWFAFQSFPSGASDTNKLPDIGIAGSSALTLEREVVLGDAIMRIRRGQGAVLHDPVLQDYIQDIGNRLVVLADDVNFPFTFFFVNDPSINAFAFFGGHIGMNTGLLALADNESEVAAVLAHEIAHVTQRHLARRLEAQKNTSSLSMASLIAGVLLAMAGGSEVALATMMGSMGMMTQGNINYTRKNEKEADRIGMNILRRSQYDPMAASSFFAKLAAKNRYNSKSLAYLQTHPLPLDRVADTRARALAKPRFIPREEKHFELAKARINVRYQDNTDWLAYYNNKQLKDPSNPANAYGLALAYFENNEFEKAQQIMSSLRFRDPRNLFYIDLATDIAIGLKHYESGEKMLQAQLLLQPNNRVLILNLANLWLQSKKEPQAIQLLRDYIIDVPDDMLSRQLLIEGYERTNQDMDVLQEKAEMYALMGAYERSVDHLHNAYNFAARNKNTLEMKRINARIGQFKKQLDVMDNL